MKNKSEAQNQDFEELKAEMQSKQDEIIKANTVKLA